MLLQAPIKWEPVDVTPQLKDGKTTIPAETITSIERNKVALKGPLAVSRDELLNDGSVPNYHRLQLERDMFLLTLPSVVPSTSSPMSDLADLLLATRPHTTTSTPS